MVEVFDHAQTVLPNRFSTQSTSLGLGQITQERTQADSLLTRGLLEHATVTFFEAYCKSIGHVSSVTHMCDTV